MYILNQNSKTPLHIQLYEELKKDIIKNYSIDEKLPSIRKVASTYNLSKNTVESAYTQLYAEGYIDSFPKRGYFVSDLNYKDFDTKKTIQKPEGKNKKEYLYDFFPARLPKDSFPIKLWKRLSTKAINDDLDFGAYPDGQGEYDLRYEISQYLQRSRGAKANPEKIIITSGFGESMQLLAKMLKSTHDRFAIENPGYHIARKAFENYGYKIDKISVDENGLVLDELTNSSSRLIYITPSHQYPKGVTMPISNRIKLLEWAKQKDAYILEDDYDSELTYYNRPIPCLQGLDDDEKIVYFGTFAKSLSPALRISYMVLPYPLLELYENYFDKFFSKASYPTQKTLALFMKEGFYDKHLRKIRTLNKKKHDLMKRLLIEKLGSSLKIESDGAGLAIHINPTAKFDWEKLKDLAEQNSIKLYFAKDVSGGDWQAIRMGFGGFSEKELKTSIDLFSKIWHKCLI